jgi:hypothetical protein
MKTIRIFYLILFFFLIAYEHSEITPSAATGELLSQVIIDDKVYYEYHIQVITALMRSKTNIFIPKTTSITPTN